MISWEGKESWHWNFVNWWSIKKGAFVWKKHGENMHQKLIPDPFLILVNNLKQPLHTGNSFTNQIFWKRIIEKWTLFFFRTECHPYVTCMSLVCYSYVLVCHSYVLVCHPYVTRMYPYVIHMSLSCTRMSSVCRSYATRMYSYVIPMLLVCNRM